MNENQQIEYTVPALQKAINWIINIIFFYRLVFVVVSLVVLIYITVQVWKSSDNDNAYKNIALVFSFGSIVIGIFYTILNYEYTQLKYKIDKKNTVISLSFNTACEWHRPTMVENLKITKLLYNKHKNLIEDNKAVDFFNILEEDELGRSALVSILNYFECVSLGVNHGILDEGFIRDYFKTVYQTYITNYGFYITHRRNIHHSPKAWVNYTDMATKWLNDSH